MKDTSKVQRSLPAEGRNPARCYAIIDLGTQKGFFNGQPKDPAPEIAICWELTKYMVKYKEDEPPQPITITQNYTYSSGERAKLPKILKSWGRLPKPITKITAEMLSKYVGQLCVLDIEHVTSKKDDDLKYANIGNKGLDVKPFEKTVTVNDQVIEVTPPKPFHEKLFFNIDAFSWDQFNKVPKHLQKKIRECEEWPTIIKKHPEPVSKGGGSAEATEEGAPIMAQDDDGIPSF